MWRLTREFKSSLETINQRASISIKLKTNMGIRNGSPLKRGSIKRCRVGQGLSAGAVVEGLDDAAVLAIARLEAAEVEGLRTGKCARVPRRCISRVTSLGTHEYRVL